MDGHNFGEYVRSLCTIWTVEASHAFANMRNHDEKINPGTVQIKNIYFFLWEISLLKSSYRPRSMLWTCCEPAVNLLWTCCEFAVNLLWICCEFAVIMLWLCCDNVVIMMLLIHSMSQHKHNFNFFANFLISNATDATDDGVINDVINTFLEYTIRPHHGRRHQLIRRQSRRVTPMILYPGRAHRLYFQYWPFVYFFCGWFVGGEPPTRRAVLPYYPAPRCYQRRMWVKWSNNESNSQ